MSVGGTGPSAYATGYSVRIRGLLPLSFASMGTAMFVYRHFGLDGLNEVYLRGSSLVGSIEEYAGEFTAFDRQVFTRFFVEMHTLGRLQPRGPETWALAFSEFTTIPGVLPQREAIFERDNWSCTYCGKCLRDGSGHIDHVYPKSRGGWDDAANVVASCQRCNLRKGARTPVEWQAADPYWWRS